MIRVFFFAALACLLTSVMYAQSQNPVPTPGTKHTSINQKEAASAQKQATKDQRGTEQFPIFVKTVATPPSQKELERERKNQQENTSINNRIANLTMWLVIVGILQFATFIAQSIILGKSLASTKRAANAAKQSVEIIPNIERAYVFVQVHFHQEFMPSNGYTEYLAKIGIVNKGKTPAILSDWSCVAWVLGMDGELPSLAETDFDKPWIPAGTVVIGADGERVENVNIQTNAVEMKLLEQHLKRLVCYGVVSYEDVFGNSHQTGFHWEYQHRFGDFYPAKDHELNYRT